MQTQGKRLLTEREVSAIYGWSVKTLQQWRFSRRGPNYVKMSARHVRYRPEDVEAFLEAHKVDLREG